MNYYFSTFVSGVSEVIENALKETKYTTEIQLFLDGMVTYKTKAEPKTIQKFRFLNNSFILIRQFKNLRDDPFKPMLMWALRHNFGNQIESFLDENSINSFRIITSKENEMVSYRSQYRKELEKLIKQERNLKHNPTKPDIEFWFLVRSEGYGFFGLRITNISTAEYQEKGQLRPQIANIMCRLSEPEENDTFLDPFAGHGTIIQERIYFPYKEIIAIEKEETLAKKTQRDTAEEQVKVICDDFFNSSLEKNSINKIVTDPPWGVFNEHLDTEKFYKKIFIEFKKVMQKQGLLVMITAQKEILETLVKENDNFQLKNKYDILVSGRKAGLYQLQYKARKMLK